MKQSRPLFPALLVGSESVVCVGGGEESGLVGVAVLVTPSVGQEKPPPKDGNMSTHERP